MDIMQILETFKNPETIHSLSMSDKLMASLVVTILGMGITFVALVLLWGCISLMSSVLVKSADKKASNAVTDKKQAPVAAAASAPVSTVDETEDEELIAVIAAAVAASLNTSIHNIIVKNIVQVNDSTPSWGKAGRVEQMNTRF